MSLPRGTRWSVAVAALMSSVVLTPAPASALAAHHRHHHPAPTAAQIARIKRQVAARTREVDREASAIGGAKSRLAQLDVTSEVAFEAYDGAEVKLTSARAAVARAHRVLAGANHQVNVGNKRISNFVTAAYETGGFSSIDTYLQPGGAAALVSRLGAANAISDSEQTDVQQLRAASIYRGVVSRQAEVAATTASAAAVVADRAKAAAAAAVKAQSTVLASLRRQQASLHALLVQARAHESRMERERLAAIARARAQAAARAAAARAAAARQAAEASTGATTNSGGASPFAGNSGSSAGTVSAATGAAALHAAEGEIGKPYVWAAAGPNTFDCSGLTMWAYNTVGVQLDHWTHDQWNEGAHISEADLRPGDLVFFATNVDDPATIHHVGMYAGNGEMVDAPFTGAFVRYDPISRPDYIGAVRPYQR